MSLIYIAHPVGSDPEQRAINLGRVELWFRALYRTFPRHAFVAPWLLYCRNLEETPAHRERGIRDDLVALKRCDGIVLTGEHLSPGMAAELKVAQAHGLFVLNWIGKQLPGWVTV